VKPRIDQHYFEGVSRSRIVFENGLHVLKRASDKLEKALRTRPWLGDLNTSLPSHLFGVVTGLHPAEHVQSGAPFTISCCHIGYRYQTQGVFQQRVPLKA
jgi:hypothetical protein